jgi:hypothetical protein
MIASLNSSFISFELTPEEEREGYKFNDNQIAVIQNLIAACAEDLVKVLITSDRNSLEEQVKLAYTKGQIDGYKCLLARSESMAEEAAAAEELARQNSQQ